MSGAYIGKPAGDRVAVAVVNRDFAANEDSGMDGVVAARGKRGAQLGGQVMLGRALLHILFFFFQVGVRLPLLGVRRFGVGLSESLS